MKVQIDKSFHQLKLLLKISILQSVQLKNIINIKGITIVTTYSNFIWGAYLLKSMEKCKLHILKAQSFFLFHYGFVFQCPPFFTTRYGLPITLTQPALALLVITPQVLYEDICSLLLLFNFGFSYKKIEKIEKIYIWKKSKK